MSTSSPSDPLIVFAKQQKSTVPARGVIRRERVYRALILFRKGRMRPYHKQCLSCWWTMARTNVHHARAHTQLFKHFVTIKACASHFQIWSWVHDRADTSLLQKLQHDSSSSIISIDFPSQWNTGGTSTVKCSLKLFANRAWCSWRWWRIDMRLMLIPAKSSIGIL